MKIIHIINPYSVPKESEANLVQKRTLESIINSVDYAEGLVDVHILMKVSPTDLDYFKNSFTQSYFHFDTLKSDSSKLERQFQVKRELPILNDLLKVEQLENLQIEDEDLIVVTNMDICLQPYFYAEVAKIQNEGRDVFVINRRTIAKELIDLPIEQAYLADGDKHIGHDCFVFPYQHLKLFDIREHILGIGFVFRPFLLNCIIHSKSFHEFDDAYLTFHYGDDMDWKNEKYNDYLEHNKELLINVFDSNKNLFADLTEDDPKLSWLKKFFKFNFLNWNI
ncbi:hypothetical protein Q4567_00110 [Aliiglaciecola sp. 2_MG-2023]|uniref:hypothetical protein n=1 Tax=unclassified Aliiglaciecola TaxID=2593648 RepID=UPI0026E35473|nr:MULTISPECIES: hypothetical protein [unclassified Aliiglaciecola]MDO6709110.1 hypothetical protein [Aliiglaciecola sp. 2_MG-2023]MDO6750258.1 hypothetical protein [Aliiglaciecola sp. 1_MG-2023]